MIYIIAYFSLFISSIFFFLSNKKDKLYYFLNKNLYLILFVFLLFIIVIRMDTGWDYQIYRKYYDRIPDLFNILNKKHSWDAIYFEPGFKFLMAISKTLSLNYYQFQALIGFITFIIFYSALKRLIGYNTIYLLIYLATCFLYLNMSYIRQGLAASIILFSFYNNKSTIKIIIGCLIATSFHFTALLFLPILILSRKKYSLTFILIIIITSIFIYLIRIPILEYTIKIIETFLKGSLIEKIHIYLNDPRFSTSRTLGVGIIEKILILSFILAQYKNCKNKLMILFFNSYIIYCLLYFLLYEATVFFDRIRFFFLMINGITYLIILNNIKNKVIKIMFFIFILLFSTFSYINTFRSEANRNIFIPYHNVFNNYDLIPINQKGWDRIRISTEIDHSLHKKKIVDANK